MPKTPTRTATKNRVLARLARADMALLKPHLAPVDLPVSTQLETANARIDIVYFMERGFASVVAESRRAKHRGRHHWSGRHDWIGARALPWSRRA